MDPMELSLLMRTRKVVDHLEQGVCGISGLKHDELDRWIQMAELLETKVLQLQDEVRHHGKS